MKPSHGLQMGIENLLRGMLERRETKEEDLGSLLNKALVSIHGLECTRMVFSINRLIFITP